MQQLEYRKSDKYSAIYDYVPNLQTVTAEKFITAYDESKTLEGVCFDRFGDMYFTSTMGFSIFKVEMKTKELHRVFHKEGIRPAAVKINKDGRLFAACLTNEAMGGVLAMDSDGNNQEWIVKGFSVDDLVFDSKGGFYFTHYIGDYRCPNGGIYYVTPDMREVIPYWEGLARPNGIALSTDEKILWITEYQANRLLRVEMDINRANVAFNFVGMGGPDSCSVDEDDNLYVALPQQGRVMVFNKSGSPIAQIVTPGREDGHNLYTTHPMVRPDTREIYITCKDTMPDGDGSCIFVAGAFAKGNKKAYQFL